jgi:hypothetical protein
MLDMATFRYDSDPRPAGPYAPDPRCAWRQWRAEYDLWLQDLSIWSCTAAITGENYSNPLKTLKDTSESARKPIL